MTALPAKLLTPAGCQWLHGVTWPLLMALHASGPSLVKAELESLWASLLLYDPALTQRVEQGAFIPATTRPLIADTPKL